MWLQQGYHDTKSIQSLHIIYNGRHVFIVAPTEKNTICMSIIWIQIRKSLTKKFPHEYHKTSHVITNNLTIQKIKRWGRCDCTCSTWNRTLWILSRVITPTTIFGNLDKLEERMTQQAITMYTAMVKYPLHTIIIWLSNSNLVFHRPCKFIWLCSISESLHTFKCWMPKFIPLKSYW